MAKLSDYVISFIEKRGVRDIFMVVGGGAIHLCDSAGKNKAIQYYACHHEQAAGIAAEAYARVTGRPGVSLVTTGPGGTNIITGVAGSWIDSVPHIIISGQVFQSQTIGSSGLRQLGVQELNIIDLVRPITKYAVMVTEPEKIRYHLEKAWHLATTGRPGPVWLDIPGDVQMATVDEESLEGYTPVAGIPDEGRLKKDVQRVAELITAAKRPVIIAGHGVKIASAVEAFFRLVESSGIPFLTARNANEITDWDHPLYAGRPGTYGQRGANFAVQNADLLIAIGTRLALPHTGYDAKDYARNAVKVMVDIDQAELEKKTHAIDVKVQCDAKRFIEELTQELGRTALNIGGWAAQCRQWKERYPVVLPEYRAQRAPVNSYHFIDVLSSLLTPEDAIVTDMGLAFQGTHQAFKVKKGQKFFTNSGFAPMGWGLPAAFGACIGHGKKRTICIAGEGGLMMNLQEMQTVSHHQLPVKVFVLNNGGYQTIRQTQEYGFSGRLVGADETSGLSFPDMELVSKAFKAAFFRISNQEQLAARVREALDTPGLVLCEVMLDPAQPQVPKFLSRKQPDGSTVKTRLEDLYPYLDSKEFKENMISEHPQEK